MNFRISGYDSMDGSGELPLENISGFEVLKRIVIGAEGYEFDSRADQFGYSVANGSPPLRYFFQALSRGDGSRHSLHASA